MCGIAGFVDASLDAETRRSSVAAMCGAMLHRGPDDEGIASLPTAAIGMRRLAIFDPANGQQPMQTLDGRFTLIFNGAIYNFRELRAELASAGWAFRTDCDTEVLLHAYAQWGEACLRRLRGMFAFAVWDRDERSLFLARDALGIKPLYYHRVGERLLFASEIKALLASGVCPAAIDPAAVSDYLAWLAVPAPRTIYRDIFSLRPGECATFRDGRLAIRTAWSFRDIPADGPVCRTREEFVRELRIRMEDTIRAHLLADVPVGAFLSGGLDSAAVVGLMTKLGGRQLRTFSIGFGETGYSEADAAAATAKHFGAEHRTRVLTGAQVAGDIENLLLTLDQPTGDGINTYYASHAARTGGVTVALSGLGGDELFGGYPSFRNTPRIARWLPAWRSLPRFARAPILRRLQAGDTRSRKLSDVLRHAKNLHQVGALQRRVFSQQGRSELLALSLASSELPFHPELAALSAELPAGAPEEIVSAWELRTYMADVLLRDSDVMSMRHSLELRVPLVDRPLIEWLWRQPAALRYDPKQPKSVLAEALQDILPPGITQRRKRGFTLPFDTWMKHELRPFLDETFSDASIERSGLFTRSAVQQRWRGFLDGHDTREWSRLWSLGVLIAFANRRATPTRPSSLPPSLTSSPRQAAPRPVPVPRAQKKLIRHRTLLMAPEIFASEGGIPRILQAYLKALCDLAAPDETVRLLALNDKLVDSSDLRRCANSRLEDWAVCSYSKPRFVRHALRMSRDCDTIICGHVAQLPVAWAARVVNRRIKYYLVAHGIEVWREFTAAERVALRGATKIFCVSDYSRRELLKHCPLAPGRAVVLHNALDPYFKIAGGRPLQECPPVILVVTRLTFADRYKGVESLIEAMPAVLAAIPEARLRIVGRGDDVGRLRKLCSQFGVAGAVEFTGFVDDQRLAEEMKNCRLFALPSRKEGFGLVFLEAMAHGRPCLGARAGGVPEVISADSGLLVEYGDIPGIAAAAVEGLRREWSQERILARAREFSYEPFKHRLAALLKS